MNDDLWVTASRDVEQEGLERVLVTARLAATPVWPFLAAATSPRDYENRKALVADRIEHVAANAADGDPVLFGVVHSTLVSGFDEDFSLMHTARLEQREAARKQAAFPANEDDVADAEKAHEPKTKMTWDKAFEKGRSEGMDHGEAADYATSIAGSKRRTSAKTAAVAHELVAMTDGASLSFGDYEVRLSEQGGAVREGAFQVIDPDGRWHIFGFGVGVQFTQPNDSSSKQEAAVKAQAFMGISGTLASTTAAETKTASTYCPNHGVYVGEGNQEQHDHCATEQRESKDSSRKVAFSTPSEQYDAGVSAGSADAAMGTPPRVDLATLTQNVNAPEGAGPNYWTQGYAAGYQGTTARRRTAAKEWTFTYSDPSAPNDSDMTLTYVGYGDTEEAARADAQAALEKEFWFKPGMAITSRKRSSRRMAADDSWTNLGDATYARDYGDGVIGQVWYSSNDGGWKWLIDANGTDRPGDTILNSAERAQISADLAAKGTTASRRTAAARCSRCGRPGVPYEYNGVVFDGLTPFEGERLCPICTDARLSEIAAEPVGPMGVPASEYITPLWSGRYVSHQATAGERWTGSGDGKWYVFTDAEGYPAMKVAGPFETAQEASAAKTGDPHEFVGADDAQAMDPSAYERFMTSSRRTAGENPFPPKKDAADPAAPTEPAEDPLPIRLFDTRDGSTLGWYPDEEAARADLAKYPQAEWFATADTEDTSGQADPATAPVQPAAPVKAAARSRRPFARRAANENGMGETEQSFDYDSTAVLHTAPGGGAHPPYEVKERDGKWIVVNSLGEVKGTHETKDQAREQQKALYANTKSSSHEAASRRLVCDACGNEWSTSNKYALACPRCGAEESVRTAAKHAAGPWWSKRGIPLSADLLAKVDREALQALYASEVSGDLPPETNRETVFAWQHGYENPRAPWDGTPPVTARRRHAANPYQPTANPYVNDPPIPPGISDDQFDGPQDNPLTRTDPPTTTRPRQQPNGAPADFSVTPAINPRMAPETGTSTSTTTKEPQA